MNHLTYLNRILAPAGFDNDVTANSMKIELMESSKKLAEQPQQEWFDNSVPGSHTALFAGNDMSLQHERDGRFHLYYLGYAARDFATAVAAKKAAPEFARRVLARLSDMIAD